MRHECVLEIDPASSTLNRLIVQMRVAADAERPAGLHLSTITNDMFALLKTYKPMADENAIGYQEIGNMWEDLCADMFRRKFGSRWVKPEPRRYRGVWCSPDGFDGRVLDEMKATWVSENDFVTLSDTGRIVKRSLKWLRYEWQVLAYMKAWGVQRARLHVWFIGGKYGFQPGLPRTYLLHYPQRLIDENWRRLMTHAKDRGLLAA